MCVVTSTSLQSEVLGNTDFRDLAISLSPFPAVIFMPRIHVATEYSMPLLSMFSKDDF